jgi:general secretion pathway protein N
MSHFSVDANVIARLHVRLGKGVGMRVLALLIGLMLIGHAEALAANTPLTVDAQTVDPGGGDLFASKPADAAAVAKPALPRPAADMTAPTTEQVTSGNPLWAIPLARLTATREQPLFAPSRRPLPVAELARPAPAPVAPPPKPPEPEKPQLSLLGTVAGTGERVGLFLDSTSKAVLRLKTGENHQGWTLRDVRPRQVELAKGLDTTVLDLPPPDLKPGPAAPAPPPAALVPPPALPVSTAKAPGVLPTLTGTGAQRAPQPAQPPAYVNPFMQQRPR